MKNKLLYRFRNKPKELVFWKRKREFLNGSSIYLSLLITTHLSSSFAGAQNSAVGKIDIGSVRCQKDLSVLSIPELKALSTEEKIAFLRSREDDSKKIALELHQLLTPEFSQKLFAKEQKLGLSPGEPISKLLTIEEIVRRLVILNSVGD